MISTKILELNFTHE
jgi:hypothetical protein